MTSYKDKWNGGKRYAHYFEIPFMISTDKADFEELTADEFEPVVLDRIRELLRTGEILEAVHAFDVEDYDEMGEGDGC